MFNSLKHNLGIIYFITEEIKIRTYAILRLSRAKILNFI
jgi:hypothetical protein